MAPTWTYDVTKFNDATIGDYPPATVGQLMRVRLWIQDTQSSRKLFFDQEIEFQITQEANAYMAAASLCDVLVARAGGVKTKKISEFFITYDVAFYRLLGASLRSRGLGHQVPYCGGISITDKERQQLDSDWAPPSFYRDLDDNPGAPQPAVLNPNPITTI